MMQINVFSFIQTRRILWQGNKEAVFLFWSKLLNQLLERNKS